MQCSREAAVLGGKGFKMFTSLVLSRIRAYLKFKETRRELSRLSDRELDDVGISRFEIDAIARDQARA